MILVDDILNTNGASDDVIKSHENLEDFSQLKRLPVNGKKCFVLPVNAKEAFKIPRLRYDRTSIMEILKSVLYLGNMFNEKGDNKDKINDRVNKAKTCMVESVSLCSEITLGVYIIQSLLLTQRVKV